MHGTKQKIETVADAVETIYRRASYVGDRTSASIPVLNFMVMYV
jgi:hypothetical protein